MNPLPKLFKIMTVLFAVFYLEIEISKLEFTLLLEVTILPLLLWLSHMLLLVPLTSISKLPLLDKINKEKMFSSKISGPLENKFQKSLKLVLTLNNSTKFMVKSLKELIDGMP
jgi:hypothetical protein